MDIFARWLGKMGLPMVITAAVAVFLIVRYEYRLLNFRDSEVLAGMKTGINSIVFCAWLILFFSLINPLFGVISAFTSIAAARANDPVVMFDGLLNTLIPIYIALLCLSVLYMAWLLMRRQLDRKLKSVL